jgi:RNA polymerase sigma-70 factor (ECF subfamily)
MRALGHQAPVLGLESWNKLWLSENLRRVPRRPGAWWRLSSEIERDPSEGPVEGEIATDLARRIAAGDSAAEAQLVERYSRGVLYLLRRTGAQPELADDLHQETFRIVLERLRRRGLEEPAGLAGFLRGTARNLALAERRKAARRRTGDDDALAESPHPAPSPLHTTLAAEQAALVRQLIGELQTERDRQILLRYYLAEEEKERICADLELESLHFNRVLFRARQRFKELLERCRPARGAPGASPP